MFKRNRAERSKLYGQLKAATNNTKSAKLSWYLKRREDGEASGKQVTAQNAPEQAITMVRELMAGYDWPSQPKFFYTGMRHTGGRMNATDINNGVITVTAELRTPIGVELGFDVPIEIRDGHMLEPSVMVFNGSVSVISQSAIDSLITNHTTFQGAPNGNMYSVNRDAQDDRRIPRRTPGMFHVASKQTALREFIRTKGAKGVDKLAQIEPDPAAVDPWELQQMQHGVNPVQLEVGPESTRPGVKKCPVCGMAPSSATAPYCSDRCRKFDQQTTQFEQRKRGQQQEQEQPKTPEQILSGISNVVKQIQQHNAPPKQQKVQAADQSKIEKIRELVAKHGVDVVADWAMKQSNNKDLLEIVAEADLEGFRLWWEGKHPMQPGQGANVYQTKRKYQAQMQSEDPNVHIYDGREEAETEDKPSKNRDRHTEAPSTKYLPGAKVKTKKKLSAPTRGGGRVTIESGKSGHVVRDMDGHGNEVYIAFEDGMKAVVPTKYLSGGTRKEAQAEPDFLSGAFDDDDVNPTEVYEDQELLEPGMSIKSPEDIYGYTIFNHTFAPSMDSDGGKYLMELETPYGDIDAVADITINKDHRGDYVVYINSVDLSNVPDGMDDMEVEMLKKYLADDVSDFTEHEEMIDDLLAQEEHRLQMGEEEREYGRSEEPGEEEDSWDEPDLDMNDQLDNPLNDVVDQQRRERM